MQSREKNMVELVGQLDKFHGFEFPQTRCFSAVKVYTLTNFLSLC